MDYANLNKLIEGAATSVAWVGIRIWIVLIVINTAWNYFGIGLGSSDLDSRNRSGVHIRTDHLTGVQYVETTKGGITPRIDKHGIVVTTSWKENDYSELREGD